MRRFSGPPRAIRSTISGPVAQVERLVVSDRRQRGVRSELAEGDRQGLAGALRRGAEHQVGHETVLAQPDPDGRRSALAAPRQPAVEVALGAVVPA